MNKLFVKQKIEDALNEIDNTEWGNSNDLAISKKIKECLGEMSASLENGVVVEKTLNRYINYNSRVIFNIHRALYYILTKASHSYGSYFKLYGERMLRLWKKDATDALQESTCQIEQESNLEQYDYYQSLLDLLSKQKLDFLADTEPKNNSQAIQDYADANRLKFTAKTMAIVKEACKEINYYFWLLDPSCMPNPKEHS